MDLTLNDAPSMDVFCVDMSDAGAASLVRKLCSGDARPGQVIPLTKEEFKALQNSVVRIQAPKENPCHK